MNAKVTVFVILLYLKFRKIKFIEYGTLSIFPATSATDDL